MKETLDYYNQHSNLFFNGTIHTDMHSSYTEFLPLVKKGGHLLDLGAGSGRDSKYFLQQGFRVTAMDGSALLCKLGSQYIGQEIFCKTFDQIDEMETYDGIWACASLLHLPSDELLPIIQKCALALKKNAPFYLSFKYGSFSGLRDGRYYTDLTSESFLELMRNVPSLSIVKLFTTTGVSSLNEETLWLNIIVKKL